MRQLNFIFILSLIATIGIAQTLDLSERVKALEDRLQFLEQGLNKRVDDLMWYQKLEGVANIDKVRYTSKPPHVVSNPTGQGAQNPLVIQAYTFIPKKFPPATKLPLMVLVHDGIHGDFNTSKTQNATPDSHHYQR